MDERRESLIAALYGPIEAVSPKIAEARANIIRSIDPVVTALDIQCARA